MHAIEFLPLLFLVLLAGPRLAGSLPEKSVQTQIRLVMDGINRLRREAGLAPLCPAQSLAVSARTHSVYQADVNQMTHDAPLTIAGRMLAAGFPVDGSRAAENVGRAPDLNAEAMLAGWRASALHRRNMLGPYNCFGVAAVHGFDMWYWTVHFAVGPPLDRPRERAAESSADSECQPDAGPQTTQSPDPLQHAQLLPDPTSVKNNIDADLQRLVTLSAPRPAKALPQTIIGTAALGEDWVTEFWIEPTGSPTGKK